MPQTPAPNEFEIRADLRVTREGDVADRGFVTSAALVARALADDSGLLAMHYEVEVTAVTKPPSGERVETRYSFGVTRDDAAILAAMR